jgi:hypothetical protein
MRDLFASSFGILFMIAYIGSLPLAIVFGDKWDVVISLIVPTYGFWVMLGAIF